MTAVAEERVVPREAVVAKKRGIRPGRVALHAHH